MEIVLVKIKKVFTFKHEYILRTIPINNNHFHKFLTCFYRHNYIKFCVKWFVHLLKLTAVTQTMAVAKATDTDRVWARDISPAVRGRIHGPVEEMLISGE